MEGEIRNESPRGLDCLYLRRNQMEM